MDVSERKTPEEDVGRVVSILQPGYLPYIGFFELMSRCDVFVLYDDVQYDKNSWRNRNRIRGPQGPLWLTVPVFVKGKMGQTINQVEIDNKREWRRKHLLSLRQHYSKAAYFSEHIGFFERLYSTEWRMLAELDRAIIDYFRSAMGIAAELINSSALNAKGHKTERILAICNELNADAYISTNGAKSYLQEEILKEAGVSLAYQDYTPPEYAQVYPGFESHLSVADIVFNRGPLSTEVMLSTSRCPFNKPGAYRGLTDS